MDAGLGDLAISIVYRFGMKVDLCLSYLQGRGPLAAGDSAGGFATATTAVAYDKRLGVNNGIGQDVWKSAKRWRKYNALDVRLVGLAVSLLRAITDKSLASPVKERLPASTLS